MKRVLLLIVTSCFALAGIVSASAVQAEGQPPSDEIIQQVAHNCQSIRNSLTQIHLRDGVFRVSRAQSYEFMSMRLMAPLNSRLLLNKVDASALVRITAQYDTLLNQFRSHYVAYDEQLAATIAIDCKQRPTEFYEALTKARELREEVHRNTLDLNQYVSQYRKSVDTIHGEWASGVKQ